MDEKKEAFTYTYSAAEREKIQRIREKYAPPAREESPRERLFRLDKSATRGAALLSLIVGVVSALILGVGMCCTMVWGEALFLPGVVIGAFGIGGVIAAYPLYNHMVRRKREKLAPEIMRLADGLLTGQGLTGQMLTGQGLTGQTLTENPKK